MWFAIDESEGEIEVVNTKEEALKVATGWISSIEGEDGWREEGDMNGIQIGEVKLNAVQVNKIHREDWDEEKDGDWPNDDWSYVCGYEMQDSK